MVLLAPAALFLLTACFKKRKPIEAEEPDNSAWRDPSDLSKGIIYEPNMQKKQLPPFEEITVVDNDDCIIKITAVDPYHIWGYSLHVYLEKKSGGERYYAFDLSSAKVNGIELAVDGIEADVHFYNEVGEKYNSVNSEIAFIAKKLKTKGIEKYKDIEIFEVGFIVYETRNKDKIIYTGTVTVEL